MAIEKTCTDDNIEYLLNKMNYMQRKVEIYDRAINEFNELKISLDEIKENSRRSKDLHRNSKEASDINSNDISTLVKLIGTLSERSEDQHGSLKEKLAEMNEKILDQREFTYQYAHDLKTEMYEAFEGLVKLPSLAEVNKKIDDQKKYFERLISQINNNFFQFTHDLKDLSALLDASKTQQEAFRKDLLRFQNALVRKGVPFDIQ
jgi:hypothetical protein